MAVFSSGSDERTAENPGRHGGREGHLSIVAAGTRIVGELITDGVVKIEGVVEGTVTAEREVLVATDGLVQGDIHTREAIVGGKVMGAICADERVEVQEHSTVEGDISTKKLIIQEGGEVNGHVRMGDAQALPQRAQAPRAAGVT